jgi:hypothetical protein
VLSSQTSGLSSDSQWAAKEGVADISLAQKMKAKVALLKKEARKAGSLPSSLSAYLC